MKLKHILILQNKIDLVKESQAKEQYEQILAFVQALCRADRMVGQVLGAVGALPEIFIELLMVNIGSLSTGGRVSAVKADLGKIVLTNPVCTEVGEKIALSRRVEKHWR
ncbi:Eukaryotic translation initiation factor 2 subunit 3 (Fragments) [Lemmus lemmus]